MVEDRFFELIDPVLRPLGSVPEAGEEFARPPLDILRTYRRAVRFHWVPILGRALSVVAVVRQPIDLGLAGAGYREILRRVAKAVDGRDPPWKGSGIGLTCLVLTPEPIAPDDDESLRSALEGLGPTRAVPLGLFRINLGQEAFAFALARGPGDLFPEPEALADALSLHLRRFVPTLEA